MAEREPAGRGEGGWGASGGSRDVLRLFLASARRSPEAVAVETGDSRATYRELELRAARLAAALTERGVEPGQPVAVSAADRVELLASLLAVLALRAVYFPLDPAQPAERNARLLAEVTEVAPGLLVLGSGPDDAFGDGDGEGEPVGGLEIVSWATLDGDVVPTGAREPRLVARGEGDDPAYLVFTSGSTGRPKGILGRLAGLDHFVRWEVQTFGLAAEGPAAGPRVAQLASPGFDAFFRDVFVALATGGTVVDPPRADGRLDSDLLVSWVDEARIEVIHAVPSLFRALLARARPDGFRTLRRVFLSGEVVTPRDVGRWTDLTADRIPLVNLYGPSETTLTKLFYEIAPSDRDAVVIPIGRPMPGSAALVVDDSGRPCRPGRVGELLLRTPYRSHGYWRRPDLTRETFVPNPFSDDPDDLVYRTGDLARVRGDGLFEFVGRKDRQVKIHGVRVEPAEVEREIAAHAAVREVAVVERSLDGSSDGSSDAGPILAAFVVAEDDLDAGQLRCFLEPRLPPAMIPTRVVRLEALPRTSTGKTDRRALPPLPALESEGGDAGPATPTEEILGRIWSEVLGLDAVGPEADFFALGGQSLSAADVVARIRHAFDLELPLRTLFDRPVLADLAVRVDELRSAAAGLELPPIEPVGDLDQVPVSFAQRRLWYVDQVEPGSPFYNLTHGVTLEGALDPVALERALAEVVRRHGALRTAFVERGGEPFQVVRPGARAVLGVVDLTALDAELADAQTRALAARESGVPFRLTEPPLVRYRLIRQAPERHALVVTMHHIASDFVSLQIFVSEVRALYDAFRAGRSSPLEELAFQYADFAVWQRRHLTDEILERELEHWRQVLGGAPEVLELPRDRAREADDYSGATVSLTLDEDRVSGLEALARRTSSTLFMVLLAGFDLLMGHWAKTRDVVVGSPVASRNWTEVEGLIGFFINALVLRTGLEGDPTFEEVLERVRATALDALVHQHLPFDRLVEEIRPNRDRSHNPLFQVTFNYMDGLGAEDPEPGDGDRGEGGENLTVRVLPFERTSAQFDLSATALRAGDRITVAFRYKRALFEASTVRRALDRLARLFDWVIADPGLRLGELWQRFDEVDREHRESARRELQQTSQRSFARRRRRGVRVTASPAESPGSHEESE